MDHFSDGVHRRGALVVGGRISCYCGTDTGAGVSGPLGAVTAVLEPSAVRRTSGTESNFNFNLELDRTHDRGVC